MPPSTLLESHVIAFWVGPFQPLAFPLRQIAQDGAVLESRILWEVGEEVSLELWFPGEVVRHRARARVAGSIRRPVPGMFIKFVDLSAGAQTALGRYLSQQTDITEEV
jgi:hypothetical protein